LIKEGDKYKLIEKSKFVYDSIPGFNKVIDFHDVKNSLGKPFKEIKLLKG
jgi:hypothetical protein